MLYVVISAKRCVWCILQCAHVMAMAVQKLFPKSKVTIGPWIDNGFYYDFDMETLTDRDLKRIKKEMGTEFISCIICRIGS